MSSEFKLEDRCQVDLFEQMLERYLETSTGKPLKHIPLGAVFDACQKHQAGGKIFTAFLDLQINLALLWQDVVRIKDEWNRHFGGKKSPQDGSILDSQENFDGKMQVHRHLNSFVLRYRAVWDKLMGVYILTHAPERYDEFRGSKSRKRQFSKIAQETPTLGAFGDQVVQQLKEFDDKYRTPEAHDFGRLRKWTLSMLPISDQKNPILTIVDFWNRLNDQVATIGQHFHKHEEG